ncbi:phage terminase large subunit [Halalkaliarchaeum desulfuricum]|uniref:Phage terminase large subunit n=1 Tax=Halalkaliarchaeum desulfuricum TaxID=2055893 RepID=A0A343TIK4_9EURY|nr:hypothetical protein [Halalkaliarchaeum desulfuricum]AUX08926.1 phage terminase large subunit [Halalkaliarchaeum desulfuricum]
MSTTDSHPLAPYVSGEQRYVRFTEDVLGVQLAEVQAKILRAVTRHKHLIIVSGNGVGKSFAIACLNLAFLYTNPNSTVVMTSGSYSQMEEATFKPMQSLLRGAKEEFPLEGEVKKSPPRIEFEHDPEHYFRCISGRYPENLEGRHNKRVQVVVDEADKPDITAEHFDSAQSSITDEKDRMVVIGNPPRDEGNSLFDLMEDPRYEVIQFSSLDSHNAQVDAGLAEGDKIPGLVDLKQIREDYRSWNRENFPGFENVLDTLETDEDTGILTCTEKGLDERWYRRRLGVIPPTGAKSVRPFYAEDVTTAENNWEELVDSSGFGNRDSTDSADIEYNAYGVDVARGGGDRTVIAGITPERVDVLESVESPGDHSVNKRLIERHVDDERTPVIMDAIGEGSGIADELKREGYNVTRFKASENARQRTKYSDCRTEALCELGSWLENGAVEPRSDVASELREAARHIELEEKSLKSGTTWKATSKSDLKKSDALGRSPDLLDAVSLAAWGLNVQQVSSNAGYSFYSY